MSAAFVRHGGLALTLGAATLCTLLAACGQKGPLYLPKKTKTEITPAATPAPTAAPATPREPQPAPSAAPSSPTQP